MQLNYRGYSYIYTSTHAQSAHQRRGIIKFTIGISALMLLIPVLSITDGNAQTEPRSQPSPQSTCVAIKPVERASTTPEQPGIQNLEQAQQRSKCALNPQSKPTQAEPLLSERDRLSKERFEQRIIPLQDSVDASNTFW